MLVHDAVWGSDPEAPVADLVAWQEAPRALQRPRNQLGKK